jgi:prepilin-type N-terminal cleavage/methylation domain-containing protein
MNRIRHISFRVFQPGSKAKRRGGNTCGPFHSHRGFTLLEVMTVVAIIAIMSGIAVYSINTNLDRIRADTAVRRVSITLNYARIRAIAEDTNYVVSFKVRPTATIDQSKCYIEMLADSNGNGVKDTGEKVMIEDLPKGVIYDLNSHKDIYNIIADGQKKDGIGFLDNKVTFLPRGNATSKGEIYIIPQVSLEKDFNDNRRAVSLERLSGRTIAWFYHKALADAGSNPWMEEGK